MDRVVEFERGPDVQPLGDAVLIRGLSALDAHRYLREGIAAVRRRDGALPNERVVRVLAGLKAAGQQARPSSSATTDIADVRRRATARTSVVGGKQVIGAEEVAHMFGVGERHVRRLAPSLGGWRGPGRGKPWLFHLDQVQAYLDMQEESA